MTRQAHRGSSWAWLAALVAILAAAVVLRNTFAEAGTGALIGWSITLGAIWLLGGVVITRLVPSETLFPVIPAPALSYPRRHALATSVALGAVLTTGCFGGGLILLQLPATSAWVAEALLAASSATPALIVTTALITGMCEEVFFRVALPHLCQRWWRWILPTLLYTAVTLASGNLALTLCAPLLGLIATAAREWTARWWAPLIVHSLWTIGMVWLFPALLGT